MTEKEEGFKSGFAVLVGRPNVGKSTLLNSLIGKKIAITSNKPQTTRDLIRGIYEDSAGQIVFTDTPGITKARNRLDEHMQKLAYTALGESELALWLVDATGFIGAEEQKIAGILKEQKKPVILVVNKIDAVKIEALLQILADYSKIMEMAAIVPVSARTKDNLDTLINVIYEYLPESPRLFDNPEAWERGEAYQIAEIVREKALHALDAEIPHGLLIETETITKRGKLYDVNVVIYCERESHKGIIIGKEGKTLKKIGTAARFEIERLLGARVNLKLWVKVRKKWRDNPDARLFLR